MKLRASRTSPEGDVGAQSSTKEGTTVPTVETDTDGPSVQQLQSQLEQVSWQGGGQHGGVEQGGAGLGGVGSSMAGRGGTGQSGA